MPEDRESLGLLSKRSVTLTLTTSSHYLLPPEHPWTNHLRFPFSITFAICTISVNFCFPRAERAIVTVVWHVGGQPYACGWIL